MQKDKLAAQVLLGLPWVVFGLNGFLNFIPMDPNAMPAPAMAFMGAMMATKYFIPFLKLSEILAGVLVLSGCYTNLGVLISAPILIQIFLFHLFLAFSIPALALPGVMTLALLYLVKKDWAFFSQLIGCKSSSDKK